MRCPRCGRETTPKPHLGALRCMEGPFATPCGMELGPAPKPARRQTEASTLRAIIAWLNLQPDTYAWRNSVGLGEVGAASRPGVGGLGYGSAHREGRMVRFGIPGAADVIACVRGRMLAVEVKSPTGRQSPAQRKFQDRIEAAGGTYVLARSVADVIAHHRRIP